MRALVLSCMILPAPAMAQTLSFDITPTAACVAQGVGQPCVGKAANQCMETSEGGYSTNGMSGCTAHELDWWDDRLNAVYTETQKRLTAADAEAPSYAPPQRDALKDMQRAWIPFRDAKCEFVATEWMGGSGAGPATLWCLMDETARQALYLERRGQN
ncbi:MAG: lysozyme inhibitor LprI family protein [Roseovarius sp.]